MLLVTEREHLVMSIDQQVKQILSEREDYGEVLISLNNRMDDVNKLMACAPEHEIAQYCQQYAGFYLFMTLLVDLASTLSTEEISRPTYH